MSTASDEPGPAAAAFVVPAEARGERLDRFLTRCLAEFSRSEVQALVRRGLVRVGGETSRKPGRLLRPDERVEVDLSVEEDLSQEPAVALHLVYEDEDIAVVNKPPHVLTHAVGKLPPSTIAGAAAARYGSLPAPHGEDRPGILHRLDRGTSGLLVLARSEMASRSLIEQFRSRAVGKRYRAIVHGDPRFDTGWIDARIGRSPRARNRRAIVGEGEGRDASTFYRVIERFERSGEFGLLDCIPKTGRTHQIRVHLEHEGHPLVGDPLYNKRGARIRPLPPDAPKLSRQALHAAELSFRHPRSGDTVRFEAPVPSDMEAVLSWLVSKA